MIKGRFKIPKYGLYIVVTIESEGGIRGSENGCHRKGLSPGQKGSENRVLPKVFMVHFVGNLETIEFGDT